MKKNRYLSLLGATMLAAGFLSASTSYGGLLNASFETGAPGPDNFVYQPVGGLAQYYGGTQDSGFSSLDASDGARIFSLCGVGSSLSQDVGMLQPNTLYTLTISIGHGNYSGTPPVSIVSLINGTGISDPMLASYSTTALTYNSDPNGVTPFQDVTFSFTTGATVSGDLTIGIQNIGDQNAPDAESFRNAFDNIRLDSMTGTVPEPSTWVGGVAVILMLLYMMTRRASR